MINKDIPHRHTHWKGCNCDFCIDRKGALKKQEDAMEKHGWFIHFVTPDINFPYATNVHTHGLPETQNHLDLQICLALGADACHRILINAIEDNIKGGVVFEHGKRYDHLIETAPKHSGKKYKVLFLLAEESGREVLRLIFPEVDGSFSGPMAKRQMQGCKISSDIDLS